MSFRLTILVVSIGLADSVNPATVAPALYLSTTAHARVKIAEFAAGFFAVNLVGGALIALGPGQLLLSLAPHPSQTTKHLVELVGGVLILALAGLMLVHRERLRRRKLAELTGKGTGFALGAGLAAFGLPTALPYFAVIATVVSSDAHIVEQIVLLALFNVVFLLPVLGILALLTFLGDRADRVLQQARIRMEHDWPTILAALLLVVGIGAAALGASGLAGD